MLHANPLFHTDTAQRAASWLFDYRRLTRRYERKATLFCAFLARTTALTCCKKLTE